MTGLTLAGAAILAFAIGYLLGSIPFGLVLTRVAGGPDLRAIGSGNIGATNVLRTGHKWLAAATLALDMLKATAAVMLCVTLTGRDAAMIAGLGAFLGHVFPVWLNFRGGKGVATYVGVLLGLAWPIALAFCAVWLAVAGATRYSSFAALIASALTAPALWFYGAPDLALLFLPLTALLWVMHRANIARLLAGGEGKIGEKTGKTIRESAP